MKSSELVLRNRGLASKADFEFVNSKSKSELLNLLNSDKPAIRTASVYKLSELYLNEYDIISELLKRLVIEKALYTKLAICEVLEKGDINTAKQMVKYLGKIGNNQYKSLPKSVSKKKSYPLPRDIISRTLGKMDNDIIVVLIEILKTNNLVEISEALDAIGFMVFYSKNLATLENLKIIHNVMEQNIDNQLIVWKVILCLSAFPLQQSISILQSFIGTGGIIEEEANRSLKLIKSKM